MHATQSKVDTGTETVGDALDAFDDIVGDIEDATSGMREIDRATDEQAESTQEVVSMVETVGDISDDTAVEAAAVADAATEQVVAVDDVESAVAQLSGRATDLGSAETFTVDEPGTIDSGRGLRDTVAAAQLQTVDVAITSRDDVRGRYTVLKPVLEDERPVSPDDLHRPSSASGRRWRPLLEKRR